MNMSDNDDDRPPADKLFDLVIQKFDGEFVEMANALGISNEELEQAAADLDGPGLGGAYAYFCRHVITSRRVGGLVSLLRPGEIEERGCVSLTELVEREARTKANA